MLPLLGSVMTKDWVHGVGHFLVCHIKLQMVFWALFTDSPQFGPVPLVYHQCQLISIFNWLYCDLNFPLQYGTFVFIGGLMTIQESGVSFHLVLYSSEQYSVQCLKIFCSCVRQLPYLSLMALIHPHLLVVFWLTVWYAHLIFHLHLLAPSASSLLFFSSLLLLHRSRMFLVSQGFFIGLCFPRISLAISVIAVLTVAIILSISVTIAMTG